EVAAVHEGGGPARPQAVRRDGSDGAGPGAQQVPELGQGGGPREAARDPDDGQRLGAVACRDGRRGGRGGGRGGRRGAGCGGRGWFRRGRCCAGRGGRGRCRVPGGQGLGDVGEGAVLEEEGAAALPQVLLQPG